MKVIFLDTVHPILQQKLEHAGFQCKMQHFLTPEQIPNILQPYHGIVIRSKIPLTAEVLEKCPNLKFIARSGAGMEGIDLDYCEKNNISCFNAPEGNRTAVAEHVLGMILSLFNNLSKGNSEIRKGIWDRQGNLGVELSGKTVGIIGYGNNGSEFAKVLQGLGVTILTFDKYKKGFGNAFVKETNLEDIFQNAEIISFHVPYNDETHHYFRNSFLNAVKKPFYLINASRGKVVRTEVLVKGLKSGHVLGACLDVLEQESSSFYKVEKNSEMDFLINSEKVLLSPHVAGWTVESYYKLSDVLANKILNKFGDLKE